MLLQIAAPGGFGLDDVIMIAAGAAVLIVLLLAVLLAIRPRKPVSAKQYDAELFKRRLALDEADLPCLHDVRIPDGRGGTIKIDHVVRLPASVALVTSAPPDVAGPVKVHPTAGYWKYVGAGGKVAQFVNPIIQLHGLIHAIRARFPLVKVRMLTVFPRAAELGTHPPRGTCMTETLVKTLKEMAAEDGAASQALETAWDQLSTILKTATGQGGGKGAGKASGGAKAAGRRMAG